MNTMSLSHTANSTRYEGSEIDVCRQWLQDDGGAYRFERISEAVLDAEGEETGEERDTNDWAVWQKTRANFPMRKLDYTVLGANEEEAETDFLRGKIKAMWEDPKWMAEWIEGGYSPK